MTFYGESIQIQWGSNGAGAPVSDFGNMYFHFDGKSETVAAGEDFTIYTYVDVVEFASTDAALFSWVVECGPASAGQLHLSHGLDPTWTPDPAYATEDLGIHAASGTTTIVVPCGLTVADYFAENDAPILHVECVAGSVEIIQIKLRAWPPDGPSGAWTTAPDMGFVTGTATAYRRLGGFGGLGGMAKEEMILGADPSVAQAAINIAVPRARGQLQSHVGEFMPFQTSGAMIAAGSIDVGTIGWSNISTNEHVGYTASAQMSDSPGYLKARPEDLSPPWVEGGGYDPREVWREALSYRRMPDGSKVVLTFAGWTGDLLLTSSTSITFVGGVFQGNNWPVEPAVLQQHSVPGWEPERIGSGFPIVYGTEYDNFAGGAQSAVSPGSVTTDGDAIETLVVPISGNGPEVAIVARPPGVTDGTATAAHTTVPNGDGGYSIKVANTLIVEPGPTGLKFIAAVPAFEYFNPSLPWVNDVVEEPHYVPGKFEFARPDLDGGPGDVNVAFAGF